MDQFVEEKCTEQHKIRKANLSSKFVGFDLYFTKTRLIAQPTNEDCRLNSKT